MCNVGESTQRVRYEPTLPLRNIQGSMKKAEHFKLDLFCGVFSERCAFLKYYYRVAFELLAVPRTRVMQAGAVWQAMSGEKRFDRAP